jgi:eukaryotic-like serine/threonine-protein kinase
MQTLGKYTLLKKIATGGMAEIWVATTTTSGVRRVCVVKRILPHLAETPDFVRMFLDEATLVATLTHPNIVQLYDVGEAAGSPFIAMEYLHGADVRAIKRALRTHTPSRMPLDHAVHIGIGAAAGLHHAHELVGLDGRALNIVHRDISPQNLLITYDGGVKVLDFGIAKSDARETETQAGTVKGKVPYMSPEQCLCEPLDRRSDVYSLGVVLYELTTGQRIHPLGASEYEMIRAIVEGSVTPPSTLDPTYPKALETIILGCLAKDRHRRYPTARALQADLDAFAREERLAVSSLSLSSYMSELFGKRAEAWREALAGGEAKLVELAARDAGSPDAVPRSRTYGAPLSIEARAASADDEPRSRRSLDVGAAAVAEARGAGRLSVVTLGGKIDERFRGAAFAEAIVGRVVLDLAGVTRVTSFGVRGWMEMIREAAARAKEIYLARCSEPLVQQMSMIKGFAGSARVASFLAPYRCERCGATSLRLLDVERDAEAIASARAPDVDCAQCGAGCALDDDAASYFAFASPHLGAALPPDVRATIDELARAEARGRSEPIEKDLDGTTTRIAVRAPLDAQLRWKRALDGIEGDLEIDLSGAPSATDEGASALQAALASLGGEVASIEIRGCPRVLAERLAAASPPSRAKILSLAIEGRCAQCDAARVATIDRAELRAAAAERRAPYAPCKRCDALLTIADVRALLDALGGEEAAPPSDQGADSRTGSTSVSSSRPPPRSSPARVTAAIGALLIAAAVGGTLLVRSSREAPRAPVGAATPAPSVAASAPEPAWASTPIAEDDAGVVAVGRGEGATEEQALALAHDDAIDHLVGKLLDDLGPAPLATFARSRLHAEHRAEAIHAAAARYLAQNGASSSPERVDAWARHEGRRVHALARYRLPRDAYDKAAAFYRATATFGGMTIAPVLPLLERSIRTSASLLVVAVQPGSPAAAAGVREGDGILAVNGHPTRSVQAFAAAVAAPTAIELRLDEGGAARLVTLPAR